MEEQNHQPAQTLLLQQPPTQSNNNHKNGGCVIENNNNNHNQKGDHQNEAISSSSHQPTTSSTASSSNASASIATTNIPPSSPFERRRYRSFKDSTGNQNVMASGTNNKRRASAKADLKLGKTKSSNQILNFFTRSQSHEPKNSSQEDAEVVLPQENEVVAQGPNPVAPPPVAKPRKQRPQSLYTKTTCSKVLQYRISGIATTPETPEVEEHLEEDTGTAGVVVDQGMCMSTSQTSGSSIGNNEEGMVTEETVQQQGMGTSGDSSRSSVSSSDSFASCGRGEDEEGDTFAEEAGRKKENNRQSLKHLSVSAPAMRTASQKSSGGDGSDTGLPPQTTSKSRQKKFHRHFKNVDQDEKVLDYYSCALVGDILLQGFLYITENYFAFYSNVFGYVTKVLIPVCTVVRITKERTAKIFPNAVGVCTRTEKHVFASLISRDTTFKLMCKVWNYSIEQEAEEIRQLQRRVAAQVEAEDGYSADVPVPDETSGDSGSGNDSAMEPSSHSPSPQNTPGIEKLVHASKSAVSSHLVAAAGAGGAVPVVVAGAQAQGGDDKAVTIAKLAAAAAAAEDPSIVPNILSYRGAGHHQYRTSIPNAAGTNAHYNTAQRQNTTSPPMHESSSVRHFIKKLGLNVGGRGPSLLLVATALLVILFVSAALLLSRISNLQQRLLERPLIHDSEQFYQELLSWQTKLHSTTGEEIHQYINSNLQQIVKVRESLEALSMLFVNRPHQGPSLGEPSSIMASGDPHHHHHHKDS